MNQRTISANQILSLQLYAFLFCLSVSLHSIHLKSLQLNVNELYMLVDIVAS